MGANAMRGSTAIVGIGATPFYKRGKGQPEGRMLVEAVLAACADAGVDPRDVDGFTSYGANHDEGPMLATTLGIKDFRFSVISTGGGGGVAGAIAAASAAVIAGVAKNVIVYRALAEYESGRQEFVRYHYTSLFRAHGIVSPVQTGALKTQRMFEVEGVPPIAMENFVRAIYHHGASNPEALSYGRPLSSEDYRASRMISDPHRVFDCSREADGAFAVLVTSAEEARRLGSNASYIVAATQSGYGEDAGNSEPYVTSGFTGAAKRLWDESGYGPTDIDVAQVYENTAGPAILGMIDHGFTTFDDAEKFFTFENLTAPNGGLPVNTAGGNLAAGFVHGMGLVIEAVRQLRGTSSNQVPDAKLSLFISGPQAQLTGSVLLGTEETL